MDEFGNRELKDILFHKEYYCDYILNQSVFKDDILPLIKKNQIPAKKETFPIVSFDNFDVKKSYEIYIKERNINFNQEDFEMYESAIKIGFAMGRLTSDIKEEKPFTPVKPVKPTVLTPQMAQNGLRIYNEHNAIKYSNSII